METQKKINVLARKFYLYLLRFWYKITWFYRKKISILAFYIIERTATWNQNYYDGKIKNLYVNVRTKESFQLKEKFVSLGKGHQQVKMLLLETPERTITITLDRINYPNIYKK